MGRVRKVPFQPWESKADNGVEKRYFRLGASIMASEAMRSLSSSAFKIYCYMRIESAGKREFRFPHCKYRTFMSKPTFFKARDELVEKGFIEIIKNNRNRRMANVYSFSEKWKEI